MTEPFETPILFLIFRQPEITYKVFEQIRAIKPTHLYISADGPREGHPEDIEECELTRAIVSKVDWKCQVHTRFIPTNLGLKKAVSSALDWFFDSVDEGIVLEYDCLPDPSFFKFCQTMLDRYRNDPRIFSICGDNLLADIPRGDGDYYYSRLAGIWGWATWKRSWKLWRPKLENYEKFRELSIMNSILTVEKGREFWLKTFDAVHDGRNNTTWAFCLVYAQIMNGGYCVVPNTNLVSNIGFGPEGTHAQDETHPYANVQSGSIKRFNAPSFFVADLAADNAAALLATYVAPKPLSSQIINFAARVRNLAIRIVKLLKV